MNRSARFAIACGVAVLLMAAIGSAQRQVPDQARPMIVVFHDGVDYGVFAPNYHADDRAFANPAAWRYLDHGVAGFVQALEARDNFRADHVYSHAIRGFAARLTPAQIETLKQDPNVAYMEPDGVAYATAQTLPWGINKIDADVSSTVAGNGSGVVTGVDAYIIDTGIDAGHTDLNVVEHVNFAGGKNTDCNGHGTHVSGTVAARDNTQDVVGVAPGTRLHGVKVLGCNGSGSWSGVVKGIDWVRANAVLPAVANMSLGGGVSQAVDDAVKRSAQAGVFYAIAAGNDGADACNSSPARVGVQVDGVMTVAATDSSDREASWSNYGQCVEIWAPGVSILSTKRGGGTTTMSGTSMATPHVTGGAALYISSHGASAAQAESTIKSTAASTGTNSKDGKAIKRLNVAAF